MAAVNGEGISHYSTEVRPWSNLPEEILALVIKCLLICDRIRFRAVCKGWRLPVDLIQGLFPIPKLPWTMEYMWKKTSYPDRTLSICKLCEPDLHRSSGSGPRSYIVETGLVEGRSNFVDSEACASREGWVLFSKKEAKGSWLFFFFSPFIKQVISLPRLESVSYEVATFSSAPTSPDCVVFVAHPPESGKIRISVYHRGCGDDKKWNIYVFDVPDYWRSMESVAYMGGSFYCHFGCFSALTSFNIANQEWQQIGITYHPNYDDDWIIDDGDLFSYRNPNYLMECEGELLLAYAASKINFSPIEGHLDDELFYLFSLDWKRKAWHWKNWGSVNGLGGAAIFIGKTSFWISGGGETEIVANRVHRYSHGIPKFFLSVENRPYGAREEKKDKCKLCYHPCMEGLQTIWIAPPGG